MNIKFHGQYRHHEVDTNVDPTPFYDEIWGLISEADEKGDAWLKTKYAEQPDYDVDPIGHNDWLASEQPGIEAHVKANFKEYWNRYSDSTTCACGVMPKIEILEDN